MTVEEAVPIALEAVKKLFDGTDHRLEEVHLQADGDFEVTVSYRAAQGPGEISLGGGGLDWATRSRTAFGVDPTRTYKDVVVANTGTVKSVRMRQIVVG